MLSDISAGDALWIIVEKLSDATGQNYAQAVRLEDGSVPGRARLGTAETHETVDNINMRTPHELLTRLAISWLVGCREAPIGSTNQVSDPLYLELVQVLVEAVMAPTQAQLRDRAVLLLAVEGGICGRALSQITWRHIRCVNGGVEITLPGEPKLHCPRLGSVVYVRERRGAACPVAALRRLREVTGVGCGLAPAGGGGILPSIPRIYEPLHRLEASGGDLSAALQKVSVAPKQIRGRAVLVIGYGAALRTREATRLRHGDVSLTPEGLLVRVTGRDNPVGLPIDPGMPGDPVHAWEAWTSTLEEQGRYSRRGDNARIAPHATP